MAKVKFTKGELKRQRDSLRQYKRYLPTLQLKKQQLQIEIFRLNLLLAEKKRALEKKMEAARSWAGLLGIAEIDLSSLIKIKAVVAGRKNVAGVDLPVFERVDFENVDYDLFIVPLWVDAAVDALKDIFSMNKEIEVIIEGKVILEEELRVTTQRVNLFEKVKIPRAEEAIRLIKIYIGDQMANAVGRSKIAKKKIEGMVFEEAAV